MPQKVSDLGSARASHAGFGALAKTILDKNKVRDDEASSPAREGACAPRKLKCFVRLGHVARAVLKAGEFFQEREGNFADRTVALLRDD